jgi:hypothetical protein
LTTLLVGLPESALVDEWGVFTSRYHSTMVFHALRAPWRWTIGMCIGGQGSNTKSHPIDMIIISSSSPKCANDLVIHTFRIQYMWGCSRHRPDRTIILPKKCYVILKVVYEHLLLYVPVMLTHSVNVNTAYEMSKTISRRSPQNTIRILHFVPYRCTLTKQPTG